ncbi:hypothetical protein [Kitasatospora sp. NPDC017646]|uniref:hypothetical protein n=1 Tax=Kitasatospora sp. NPDC017646 TaxID=3364024 RepID=UPI0037A4BD20
MNELDGVAVELGVTQLQGPLGRRLESCSEYRGAQGLVAVDLDHDFAGPPAGPAGRADPAGVEADGLQERSASPVFGCCLSRLEDCVLAGQA